MQKKSGANLFKLISFLAITACFGLSSCALDKGTLLTTESLEEINGSDIYVKKIAIGKDHDEVWKREPILIIHGGPVLDHTYFMPHLNSLAEDYQLIFYDQRATGRSGTDIDSAKMNLAAFVEDIELLRQSMGFEKINVIGHSWGGLLAMAYATEHSDKMDHLILANSMAPNVRDWQKESAAVADQQTPEDIEERKRILDSLRANPEQRIPIIKAFLMTSFKPQMYDRANLDKLELHIPEDYDLRSGLYRLFGRDMASFDYDNGLNKITCPTLLVYGETEPATTIYTEKMLNLIPDSKLEVIEEAGHFPFIEQPKAFRKVILDFLK